MADETGFWLYLVEHAPGGLSAAQLAVVHRALGEAVGREIRPGSRIRYVQRIDVPGEHRCLWLFEAAGPEAVRAVNDLAQFPLTRVITVLSAAPGETSPIADLEQAGPDRQNAPPAAPEETDENVARRLAKIPAGSWTNWPVVGCWVAVVAAAYPLTGKLNGAQKNDTSGWLPRQCRVGQGPGCADPPPATQHLPRGGRVLPGLRADRGGPGQGGRRRRRFAGLPEALTGQVAGPIPSADGTAMQTIEPVNVGTKGYNGASAPVASTRAIARARANGLASHITGLLGYAEDSAKEFTALPARCCTRRWPW